MRCQRAPTRIANFLNSPARRADFACTDGWARASRLVEEYACALAGLADGGDRGGGRIRDVRQRLADAHRVARERGRAGAALHGRRGSGGGRVPDSRIRGGGGSAGAQAEEATPATPPTTAEEAKPAALPAPAVEANPAAAPTPAELADAAADKYGLPRALVRSVMAAESGMNPLAASPKGAIGLMQLMPRTAQTLGANPYDPAQNVDAGARYLRDLLLQYNFGLWHALAAYNAGPGAVAKYGGIPPYRETIDYILRVDRDSGAEQKHESAEPDHR